MTHLPVHLHLLRLLLLHREHGRLFLRERRARPGRRHSHRRVASILGYALEQTEALNIHVFGVFSQHSAVDPR